MCSGTTFGNGTNSSNERSLNAQGSFPTDAAYLPLQWAYLYYLARSGRLHQKHKRENNPGGWVLSPSVRVKSAPRVILLGKPLSASQHDSRANFQVVVSNLPSKKVAQPFIVHFITRQDQHLGCNVFIPHHITSESHQAKYQLACLN